jgi:hypothetical protein
MIEGHWQLPVISGNAGRFSGGRLRRLTVPRGAAARRAQEARGARRHVEISERARISGSMRRGKGAISSSVMPLTRRWGVQLHQGVGHTSQIRLRATNQAIEVWRFPACSMSPRRDAADNQILNTMAIKHRDQATEIRAGPLRGVRQERCARLPGRP